MAEDEQIGAMMAENLNLKDIVAEQNETVSELRQQLLELNERLAALQSTNKGTEHVRSKDRDTFQAQPMLPSGGCSNLRNLNS